MTYILPSLGNKEKVSTPNQVTPDNTKLLQTDKKAHTHTLLSALDVMPMGHKCHFCPVPSRKFANVATSHLR